MRCDCRSKSKRNTLISACLSTKVYLWPQTAVWVGRRETIRKHFRLCSGHVSAQDVLEQDTKLELLFSF